MAKWTVTQIVHKRGCKRSVLLCFTSQHSDMFANDSHKTARCMENAETMSEARMGRAGVYEIRKSQLFDAAKTLKCTGL